MIESLHRVSTAARRCTLRGIQIILLIWAVSLQAREASDELARQAIIANNPSAVSYALLDVVMHSLAAAYGYESWQQAYVEPIPIDRTAPLADQVGRRAASNAQMAYAPHCDANQSFVDVRMLRCNPFRVLPTSHECNSQQRCIRLKVAQFLSEPSIHAAIARDVATISVRLSGVKPAAPGSIDSVSPLPGLVYNGRTLCLLLRCGQSDQLRGSIRVLGNDAIELTHR
jgi:hypothetical protein